MILTGDRNTMFVLIHKTLTWLKNKNASTPQSDWRLFPTRRTAHALQHTEKDPDIPDGSLDTSRCLVVSKLSSESPPGKRESGEGEVMKIKTSMGGRMVHLLELLICTRKFSALLVAPFRKYWLGSCPPLGIGNTERDKLLPLPHLSHALRHHVWSVLPPRLLALPHSLSSSSPSRVLPPSFKSLSRAHIWAKQHIYTKNSHYSIVYSSQRLKRPSLNIRYRELVK